MTQARVLTGQDIAEAQGAVQGLLEQALAGTGSTSREYVVLRVLAARGPFEFPAILHDYLAGQRQLALSPAAVSELLAGTELLRSLTETVAPATRELFAGIAPQDLATAHRVLQQVIEQAHRLRGGSAN